MRPALVLALAGGLVAALLASPAAHALPTQPAGLAGTPSADIDIGFGIGVGTCAPAYGPYRVGYCTPATCAPQCLPVAWWRPVTYVACMPTYTSHGAHLGYSGRPAYATPTVTCVPVAAPPVVVPYPAAPYVVGAATVTYGSYGYAYPPTYVAPYGYAYGSTTYSVGSRSWFGVGFGWSSGVRTYPYPYAYPYGYPYAYPRPYYVPSPRYPSTYRGGAVHTPGRRR
ncbi:MAG: hypothetical protein ACKOSS_08230 [Planctomycetia bacterium]